MENFNTTFLEELYLIEPSLKEKESEIITLIEKMTIHRPAVEIDDAFRKRLKQAILQEFSNKKTYTFNLFQWMNIVLPVSLAAFAWAFFSLQYLNDPIGETPPAMSVQTKNENIVEKIATTDAPLFETTTIQEKLPEKAFWSLGFLVNNTSSRPQGGGGGPMMNMAVATDVPVPTVSDDIATTEKMDARMMTTMPVYDMPQITYVYSGELILPIGNANLPVYERSVTPLDGKDVMDMILQRWIAWFDLSPLKQSRLTMLSFSDTTPFGYMYNFDFLGGTFSVYQNYETWPQPVCNASGCKPLPTLTKSDLESDDVILEKASNFLKKFRIDLAQYGGPFVHTWYAPMPEGSIPEVVNITYPILLDGKMTYEENGEPRGLTLTYDVRNKKIWSLYGIGKESLRSSEYPITTNPDKILSMLSQGGRWGGFNNYSENAKKVFVWVQSPELWYMRMSHMDETWKQKEYLIPAYIFKVEKNSDPTISTPQNITIPLIDDFLTLETPQPMLLDMMVR